MNRTLNVTTPPGPDASAFEALAGREARSQWFDLRLTMERAQDLFGQPMTVDFQAGGDVRRLPNVIACASLCRRTHQCELMR